MTKYKNRGEAIDKYIDILMKGSTPDKPLWNQESIRLKRGAVWNYIDGCMITAVLALYEDTKDKKYLDFADSYVGWFVCDDGKIKTYDPQEKNLDNISMGRNLFMLYDITGKEKYHLAADVIRSQIDIQPRTKAGSFWHKQIYPDQVWLDGLYMAEPFYTIYETRFRKMEGYRDIMQQFFNVRKYQRDEKTGLYYHGYDESREMYWADKTTGCSENFWLRAEGWFAAALVDTIDAMSETMYYEVRQLSDMFKDLVDSMIKWQDDSGMFYQVINYPGEEGNYLETSGSALFAYAVLKGVRLKVLPERYSECGVRAFEGIMDKYLTIEENSDDVNIELGGICMVAGLGGKTRRDGTRKYYYSEPVVENDAKGIGPFVLAYTEMRRRKTYGLQDIGHL